MEHSWCLVTDMSAQGKVPSWSWSPHQNLPPHVTEAKPSCICASCVLLSQTLDAADSATVSVCRAIWLWWPSWFRFIFLSLVNLVSVLIRFLGKVPYWKLFLFRCTCLSRCCPFSVFISVATFGQEKPGICTQLHFVGFVMVYVHRVH